MSVKKSITAVNEISPPAILAKNSKSWGFIVVIAILIVGITFLAVQNRRLKNSQESLQNKLSEARKQISGSGQNAADTVTQDNQKLIEAMGQLMVLPTDETPTIATVTDLEKLKDQPFFTNAQVGDKVLIYTNAKKAILYRPSENKVIELAPLNIGDAKTSTQNISQKLTVEIRNGSGKTGAAGEFKNKLLGNKDFLVTKTTNAAAVYDKSVLYVTDAKRTSSSATSLSKLSSAQIGSSLPGGEAASTADAVLILGKE